MNATLNRWGGMAGTCTRGHTDRLEWSVGTTLPDRSSLEYALSLESQGLAYRIAGESLSQERGQEKPFKHIESRYDHISYYDTGKKRLLKADWSPDPLESALSQVPKMFREPEAFRHLLSAVGHHHLPDVSRTAPIKLPQQMWPARFPGGNGEDLVSFLYTLRESDRDRYEQIEATLQAAFPEFECLNFPPVAAGMLSMTWKEALFTQPLYMHQLSDGMIRFLWLVALLHSPTLSTITMIDEPEVSLHPELLSLLADLLREASSRAHIIVATHSDRLVRFLKPEEIVVLDKDEAGLATACWADTLDLEAWLAEYSLDEVWRMGRLGGRA
ncbi:MAG: AAA family ATPase [Magnetococcales bacterium]|nr:AAA family ATPase [Magnetococcales bacterium]